MAVGREQLACSHVERDKEPAEYNMDLGMSDKGLYRSLFLCRKCVAEIEADLLKELLSRALVKSIRKPI